MLILRRAKQRIVTPFGGAPGTTQIPNWQPRRCRGVGKRPSRRVAAAASCFSSGQRGDFRPLRCRRSGCASVLKAVAHSVSLAREES